MVRKTSEKIIFFRSIAIFGITFFLITMLLTALVIIPEINKTLESQHSKDTKVGLELQAELFTNFVNSQKSILQDLATFPSLVNAAMLSDGSNPVLLDLFENVVIGGNSARLLLQDIAGNVLIQTTDDLHGTYIEGSPWSDRLLNGSIPFYFRLLSQQGDQFTFQLSIPIIYNTSIEGVLSAEIKVSLTHVFVSQSHDHVAFQLVQEHMTVHTESSHIKIARKNTVNISHPNLTFIYITDDAVIKEKEESLRNTVFSVLLFGLGISFLLFTLFGYRSLISRDNITWDKIPFGRAYAMPILVSAMGLAASVTAFLLVFNNQKAVFENDILSNSKRQVKTLRESFDRHLQVLNSTKAFFDASNIVSRQDFNIYVTPLLADHPNIQALQWIPNVTLSERTDYESQARKDGSDGFSILELDTGDTLVPAGPRDYYFPVHYAEPVEGNEKAIGFDLSSNNQQLAALTNASRTANKVATPPITLKQENASQSGLHVYYPIYYQSPVHESIDTGEFDNVKGFTLMVLRAEDLIADVIASEPDALAIRVQDISEPDHPQNIFGDRVADAQYTFSDTINIASRTWQIDTTVNSVDVPGRWLSWLILIGGVLFTVLLAVGLTNLIRRREMVETLVKQRTSELRMLSSIVAKSNDSFMITDARNPDPETGRRKIVYVNEAFTLQTGYHYDEIVGETPYILHGELTDKTLVKELTDSISRGAMFRGDFIYYKKNKKSYWVDVNVVSITNEAGDITHYGAVQRDITDIKQSQVERENLIGKLMDSNEELARFAFVCSHDLQEPLRMIRSFTEKLQHHISDDLANDEKGKKYMGFITDGAERAQNLITDILAYSSISTSTQPLETVDGMALIDNIKQLMGAALESNGGKVTHDALPILQGNRTQLYQLFQNLINNALKYQRPNTSPHVHVGVSDVGTHWQFSVKDNGIGMEQRHLSKIFDVFQRLHRRNQYAGTGVGLSICKKVVEQHGGIIRVESESGIGSTFHFTLLKPTVMEINDERERKAG